MKLRTISVLGLSFAFAILLSACGKSGSSDSSLSEPLNGKIAGQSWKVNFALARYSVAANNWRIAMYALPHQGDPCTAKYKQGEDVYLASFSIKELIAADYNVSPGSGSSVSLTKAKTDANGYSSSSQGGFGTAKITKVEGENVLGQLDVRGNDSNYVKGTFTAKVCP